MKLFNLRIQNRTFSSTTVLAVVLWWAGLANAPGAPFNSGSDGSYGPINITSNTVLNMPSNGIFHCTTITIEAGMTLYFNPNPLNTPVYLLATSNVTINGTINVSGGGGGPRTVGASGGPGGFAGGRPSFANEPPGSGFGPGAGRGGFANYTDAGGVGAGGYGGSAQNPQTTNNGGTYGNTLLIPLIGGSGGGGTYGSAGFGGGGGGGAILIASNMRIDVNRPDGQILALGGQGSSGFTYYNQNGGSGGAIRLVAPIVAGDGNVLASGSFGGGYGRIRIDTFDRSGLNLSLDPRPPVTSLMTVFPPTVPRLDILHAAGTDIPEGQPMPVFVELPLNSPTNQAVTIQARDFNAMVPISVVLTPDSGDPLVYQATLDNRVTNPAQTNLTVQVPPNMPVAIHAWTR